MGDRCEHCERNRSAHAVSLLGCGSSLSLDCLAHAYPLARAKLTKLEAAARAVVAADTYVTKGVSRLEGIQRALLDLETLLPEPPAQCAELEKVR